MDPLAHARDLQEMYQARETGKTPDERDVSVGGKEGEMDLWWTFMD
jgi:hypothetical protein